MFIKRNKKLFLIINLVSLLTGNLIATNLTTFYNPNVDSTPHVSLFGDTLVAQRNSQINVIFAYSIPPDKILTTTNTTGTAASINSMACIQTGTSSTGSASVESRAAVQYAPGHSTEYLFTAVFTPGISNSTQWIGSFNDNDGFAIGFNDAVFSILHRNSLASNVTVAQKDFNVDRLDGSGPSGITLNYTNLNIFKISFGWLGSAPINFLIMRDDGHWFKFHTIKRPNAAAVPSVGIPMLQMKAEIKNRGNTSNLKLCTASWMGGTIGTDDATIVRICDYHKLGVSIGGTTMSVINKTVKHDDHDDHDDDCGSGGSGSGGSGSGGSGSGGSGSSIAKPILSIRNKTIYKSKINYLQLKILFINVSSETGNVLTTFGVIKNGTLTGANWSDYLSDDTSITEVDGSATTITGGRRLLSIFGSNDSSTNHPILANDTQIILLPGDTLTVTAYATSAAKVNASISWQEPAI